MTKGPDGKGAVDPFDPVTWGDEDTAYFGAIDVALRNKDKRYISNGRPEHAAFLVHRFLENAVGVVRIYSGSLSRTLNEIDVYGNPHIIAAAKDFLGKNGRILVVVQNELDLPSGGGIEDHPFVGLVKDIQRKGSLVVKRAGDTDGLSDYHWMVMDESAYRLETDIKSAIAHANFGTPKVAMQLAQLFDSVLFENGQTLFEWPENE